MGRVDRKRYRVASSYLRSSVRRRLSHAAPPRIEQLEDRRVLAALFEPSADLSRAEGESVDVAFQVPAGSGESMTRFTWVSRHASYNNEMGLYVVDDAAGTVDGLNPDDPAYPAAALARSQVIFASSQTQGAVSELALAAGSYFGLYLIQNATTQRWLSLSETGGFPLQAFFSFDAANPGDAEQFRAVGANRYGWEDLGRGGDQDYNDLLFEIDMPESQEFIGNRAITSDGGVQQNPSVAVNPNDPDHVVIAYMDYSLVDTGYAGIGVAVSRDGGQTWESSQVPVPEPFEQGAASPTAVIDDQGHVIVAYMAVSFVGEEIAGLSNPAFGSDRIPGFESNNGIFVVRSDDGGINWADPIAVASYEYDPDLADEVPFDLNPVIALDNVPTLPNGQPNQNFGNLYATWTRVYPAGQFPNSPMAPGGTDIRIAISRDGGLTWETQPDHELSRIQVDELVNVVDENGERVFDPGSGTLLGEGFIDYSHISVGGGGEVYVSHFGGEGFALAVSTDGGETFELSDFQTDEQIMLISPYVAVDKSGLPGNRFRTIEQRAIAADSTQSGVVFGSEGVRRQDALGNEVDPGEILFGRSVNYANSFDTSFNVGIHANPGPEPGPVNDDNGSVTSTSLLDPERVASGQALPRIATDSNGRIALVWYDTRRDPRGVRLDVFGVISDDSGESFTPNFRITDQSFDANRGSFINAVGEQEFYLGDSIGLVMSDSATFVAWTDTRNGNQDIYFSRFQTDAAPPTLNDRFEPNDDPSVADSLTVVGPVIRSNLPKLKLVDNDEDWFQVVSSGSGTFRVNLALEESSDPPVGTIGLELWDPGRSQLLATGVAVVDEGGNTIGLQLSEPAKAGDEFLIKAFGSLGEQGYSLHVESITEDFGKRVHVDINDTLVADESLTYLVTSVANGSIEFDVLPDDDFTGSLTLTLLDPGTLQSTQTTGPLTSTNSGHIDLQVDANQSIVFVVTTDDSSEGSFQLQMNNRDLLSIPGTQSLFFPVPDGSSQASIADVNNDQIPDVVVTSVLTDTLSVLLGSGNGFLQTPRQFSAGAYKEVRTDILEFLPTFGRDVGIADFDGDQVPDAAVINSGSADLSILLGNGDGTLRAQRRFDATPDAYDIAIGDLNSDGLLDVVVSDASFAKPKLTLAALLNLGDGIFATPKSTTIAVTGGSLGTIRLGDFNEDGILDLVAAGDLVSPLLDLALGNGDGTFTPAGRFPSSRRAAAMAIEDVNGDGHLDIATAGLGDSPFVSLLLGNGDATFQDEVTFANPNGASGMQIVDVTSQVEQSDGSLALGMPDGRLDVVLSNFGSEADRGQIPSLVVLPGLVDANGDFAGFGESHIIAVGDSPLDVDVDDLNGDGMLDFVVVDRDGILLAFLEPPDVVPNNTLASARDLGTVVHFVDQTQTIVLGREDAYYKFTVPTEVVTSADQVVDISLAFEAIEGPGIDSELLDAQGNLLGRGGRFRIRARQGEELVLHVFGVNDGTQGYGAFTPIIDVLPQVVSVESQALLPGATANPGGPTTAIVVTFQGDRLDPATAEDPTHYTVTAFGPDRLLGTDDDQTVSIREVVYSPSTNVDVSSGRTYPTAIRQTATLLFDSPLPAGSYRVQTKGLQTESFNQDEVDLLADLPNFGRHPLVSLEGGFLTDNVSVTAIDLVLSTGALGDLGAFAKGTRFLSQLRDDLSATLDAALTELGDDPSVSGLLLDQIVDRLAPALGDRSDRPVSLFALFLDPVSLNVTDLDEEEIAYDLAQHNDDEPLRVTDDDCYVEVGGNIEVIVCPIFQPDVEQFDLTVNDVPETVRGGYAFIGPSTETIRNLTPELRSGTTYFRISFP